MVEELAIFEMVEVDFGGLCAESDGGELSLDQMDDLEQGMLTFFENEEQCQKAESDVTGLSAGSSSIFDGGIRLLQTSSVFAVENDENYEIESVTLIEFIESDECANTRAAAPLDTVEQAELCNEERQARANSNERRQSIVAVLPAQPSRVHVVGLFRSAKPKILIL